MPFPGVGTFPGADTFPGDQPPEPAPHYPGARVAVTGPTTGLVVAAPTTALEIT